MNAHALVQPAVVGSLLLGADQFVAEYVRARIPNCTGWDKFTAVGVVRHGELAGGVVFHNFRARPDGSIFDLEVVLAFDSPAWALPGTLRALFDYPFNQLGCVRITSIIARKNKRARRFTEGLGWVLEGVAKHAMDGVEDACVYRMTRQECRWLRLQ